VQGPLKKYPAVTGAQFTKAAMERNYSALKAKQAELSSGKAAVTVSVSEVAPDGVWWT